MLMLLNRVPAELLGSKLPPAYEDALSRLYRAIREVAGKSVVVDSSRELSQALVLARIPSIDLRVLHLVRDSRAVAFSNSRRKPQFRDDNGSQHRKPVLTSSASSKLAFDEDGIQRILPRRGAVESALIWTWRNAWASAIPRLRRRRKIPYARLRYEDLVRDPREGNRGCAGSARAWQTRSLNDSRHLRQARGQSRNQRQPGEVQFRQCAAFGSMMSGVGR